MATQSFIANVADNAASYEENMRSLLDQFSPNNPNYAFLTEIDSGGAGKSWINDLLTIGQDVSAVVAVAEDGAEGNLLDQTYVPTPIETPFQTWGLTSAVAPSGFGGAIPGNAGDITRQEMWLAEQAIKAVEKSIVSNQPSSYPSARSEAGITSGMMNYSAGEGIPLGTGGTAYTHAGYNATSKTTALVNDVAADAQSTRGFVSLQHIHLGTQRLSAAQSGANVRGGASGQRSSVEEGGFIAVIPQALMPNIIVPTSGVASQVRLTDERTMVYKRRIGQEEGLAYPMSPFCVKTQQGTTWILPGMEQARPSGNTANRGALAFMYDPMATQIVWKLRPEAKRVYAKNVSDETVMRSRYALAGVTTGHCIMLSHIRSP